MELARKSSVLGLRPLSGRGRCGVGPIRPHPRAPPHLYSSPLHLTTARSPPTVALFNPRHSHRAAQAAFRHLFNSGVRPGPQPLPSPAPPTSSHPPTPTYSRACFLNPPAFCPLPPNTGYSPTFDGSAFLSAHLPRAFFHGISAKATPLLRSFA